MHNDNKAVDRFARAMRIKLAQKRDFGYCGWETCDPNVIAEKMAENLIKGDMVDVANLAMMLHFRNKGDLVRTYVMEAIECD